MNKKSINPYGVAVGQVWQDYDVRFRSQQPVYKTILSLTKTHAVVESRETRLNADDKVRKSKIRLDRFRPNNNGYLFVCEGNQATIK